MTSGSSLQAMIRTVPPQAGQVSMSIPNTRFRRCAQVIAARRSAGVGSSKSAVVACWPPLPRLAGVTCARCLLFGAKTPTPLRFFRWLGSERSGQLKYICSDMWKPYLTVIAKKAMKAVQVLDRFHIMAHLGKAIDEVRAQEAKALKAKGYEPVLSKARFLLLKRPENLSQAQEVRLAELLKYNLRAVRAYLLKEEFQFFWTYVSPYWAGKFLDRWCTKTMRSKIEPMKKVARMLRAHRQLLLDWFRARGQLSSGVVEGFNGKAKLIRTSDGRRRFGWRGGLGRSVPV